MEPYQVPRCIEHVPPELWKIIFGLALPLGLCGDSNKPSPRHAPLSVSQTCRKWRDISIDTPYLWSSVSLDQSGYTQSPNPRLIDLWLFRSANSPLTVDLRIVNVDVEADRSRNQSIWDLFSTMDRWKSTTLRVRGFDLFSIIMNPDLADKRTSLLENLDLDIVVQAAIGSTTILPDALWTGSPRLRRLSLSFYFETKVYSNDEDEYSRSLRWATSSGIPYSQLTSLRIDALGDNVVLEIEEAITFLKGAPNLISCLIGGICNGFNYPLNPPIAPVVLEHLKYLHLNGLKDEYDFSPPSVVDILNHITAPSLVTLAFGTGGKWSQLIFNNFVNRSGCQLQEIYFIDTSLLFQTVLKCMQILPSLRGLHIDVTHNADRSPRFLDDMKTWNTMRAEFELCPKLEWISLSRGSYFMQAIKVRAFEEMLKHRLCPPDGREKVFKKLYVPADSIYKNTYRGIRALCDEPYWLDVEADADEIFEAKGLWKRYGNQ